MNITAVIIAAVIVGGTGLFIGVFLGLAGKKFAVEVDEREEAILGVLPGNNCGGGRRCASRSQDWRDYGSVCR
mgnify:CR=1 FL=1